MSSRGYFMFFLQERMRKSHGRLKNIMHAYKIVLRGKEV
jgi:hypothetical protein